MSKTAAQVLVDSLIAAGVRHLFTLSGNQILSIYDASIGHDIQLIHTRHEAAAVHMADAWGRLIEDPPGVALVTAGPGHCNALSALYVALMAESPLLLLSGHCPRSQIGKGAFQEIDQVAAARPVTKASWLVEDPDEIGNDIRRALSLCQSGRPGPVHLSLPGDVLESPVQASQSPLPTVSKEGSSTPTSAEASEAQVLDLLQGAERPVIVSGPAMARNHRWAQVTELAQVVQVPALPMDSPRGVNDPWMHGANHCLLESDLVLLLGKKLDFSLRFGESPFSPETRFVQIDADAEELRQHGRVVLAIHEDPAQMARSMTAAARDRRWRGDSWRQEVQTARAAEPDLWSDWRQSSSRPIHPLRVCETIQPYLDQGAILVSDGGEFGQWAQAGLAAQIRLTNGPSGAIGSSIPMAIAAKLAHPERQVVAISGDGTFGYHLSEFDTAVRYALPLVVVVGNDARWNAEYQLQVQHYGEERAVACELLLSRYDKAVEGLGGYGEFVSDPREIASALERSLESQLPACVNIHVEGVGAPTF